MENIELDSLNNEDLMDLLNTLEGMRDALDKGENNE